MFDGSASALHSGRLIAGGEDTLRFQGEGQGPVGGRRLHFLGEGGAVGKVQRRAAGGDAEAYAQLISAQFGAGVGESLEYRAPAGDTRFFCASVELLPLTEAERCAVSARWLEANDAVTFEEDAGWTLIA